MSYDAGTFQCDTCSDHIATGEDDFTPALTEAKSKGWKAYVGPDKEYAHSCPSCVETWKTNQRV